MQDPAPDPAALASFALLECLIMHLIDNGAVTKQGAITVLNDASASLASSTLWGRDHASALLVKLLKEIESSDAGSK